MDQQEKGKTTTVAEQVFEDGGPAGNGYPVVGLDGPVYRNALQDFLQKLISYMKACRLYPSGHERPVKMGALLMESLATAMDSQEELLVLVSSDGVSVNGEEFSGECRVAAAIAPDFTRRNVRSLTLSRGVALDELETVAHALLQDPQALIEKGGVSAVLGGDAALPHIEVKEFSYASKGEGGDGSAGETTATGEPNDQPIDGEELKTEQATVQELSPEEKQKFQRLLEHPSIADQVDSFRQLISQFRSRKEFPLGADDLLMHLIKNILMMEIESRNLDEAEAEQLALRALDQLLQRVFSDLGNKEEYLRKDVLDLIACKMIATPENLLWWLSHQSQTLDLGVTPDHAEMIKVIFNRTCKGPKRIRFGKTEMTTLDTPATSGELRKKLPKKKARETITPLTLESGYRELQKTVGNESFRIPEIDSLNIPHFEVLLEMLRIEEVADARDRILEETARFAGQVLAIRAEGAASAFSGLLDRLGSRMEPQELAAVLRACGLAGEALDRFARGDEQLLKPLTALARSQPSRFAETLGRFVLESGSELSLTALDDLISPCQDALVSWLWNGMDRISGSKAFERAVNLIRRCHTPRVVPLIERLMRKVERADRWTLIQVLGTIDTSPAVRVIRDQLSDLDLAMKSTALAMLGQSKHSLAEEILLEMAQQRFRPWGDMEERLIVIHELGRCGRSRSQALLKKISRRWYLSLLPGGSKVRNAAIEALDKARTGAGDRETETEEADHEF